MAKLGRVRRRETPGGKVRYFLDFGALGRIYKGRDVLGEWDFETPDQAEDYLRRIPCKPDVFAATYEEVNDAD